MHACMYVHAYLMCIQICKMCMLMCLGVCIRVNPFMDVSPCLLSTAAAPCCKHICMRICICVYMIYMFMCCIYVCACTYIHLFMYHLAFGHWQQLLAYKYKCLYRFMCSCVCTHIHSTVFRLLCLELAAAVPCCIQMCVYTRCMCIL